MELEVLFGKYQKASLGKQQCLGKNWLVNLNNTNERVSFDYELPLHNIYNHPTENHCFTSAFHLYRNGEDFICTFWNVVYRISNMISVTFIPCPTKNKKDLQDKDNQILIGLSKSGTIDLVKLYHFYDEDRTFDVIEEFTGNQQIGILSSEYLPYFPNINFEEYNSEASLPKSHFVIDSKWKSVFELLEIREFGITNKFYCYCPKAHLIENNSISTFRFSSKVLEYYTAKDVFYHDKYQILCSKGMLDLRLFRFYSLVKLYNALKEPYQDFSYFLFNSLKKNPLVLVTRNKYLHEAYDLNFMIDLLVDETFVTGLLYDTATESFLYTQSYEDYQERKPLIDTPASSTENALTHKEEKISFDEKAKKILLCEFETKPYILSVGTEENPLYEIHIEDPKFTYYTDSMPTVIISNDYFDILFFKMKSSLNPKHPIFFVSPEKQEIDKMVILDSYREVVESYPNIAFHELLFGKKQKKNISRITATGFDNLSNHSKYSHVFCAYRNDILIVKQTNGETLNPYFPIDHIHKIETHFKNIHFDLSFSSYKPFYYSSYPKNHETLKELLLTHSKFDMSEEKYVLNHLGSLIKEKAYLEEMLQQAHKIST